MTLSDPVRTGVEGGTVEQKAIEQQAAELIRRWLASPDSRVGSLAHDLASAGLLNHGKAAEELANANRNLDWVRAAIWGTTESPGPNCHGAVYDAFDEHYRLNLALSRAASAESSLVVERERREAAEAKRDRLRAGIATLMAAGAEYSMTNGTWWSFQLESLLLAGSGGE